MADDAASLVVQIRADQSKFTREMSKIARDASRAADRVEKGFQSANSKAGSSFNKIGTSAQSAFRQAERGAQSYSSKLDQISRKMESLSSKGGGGLGAIGGLAGSFGAGILGGAAAAVTGREIAQLIDASTRMRNALKVAGIEGQNLENTFQSLGKVAMDNGANMESLVGLYSRITQSSKQLGVSQDQVFEFTRRMAVGLKASGTDSQQASDGIRQLTQALASGLLRGDEFNSVMENLPVVAQSIAKGLGVTTGELRKMAEAGQLSAKTIFDAFIKGSADLDAQAAKTSTTFSQSMTNLGTALTLAADKLNNATGVSAGFAGVVNSGVIPAINTMVDALIRATGQAQSLNEALLMSANGGRKMTEAQEKQAEAARTNAAAIDGVIDVAKELERDIVAIANETGRIELAATFKDLEQKILDGTATAEDFNKVIMELIASGGDLDMNLTAKVIGLQAAFSATAATAKNETATALQEVFNKMVQLGTQGSDEIGKANAQFTIMQQLTKGVLDQLNQFGPALDPLNAFKPGGGQFFNMPTGGAIDPKFAKTAAAQAEAAMNAAAELLGKNEKVNTAQINSFLQQGGVNLNSATTAWCAAFVNSALAQMGIKGSGSMTATDFAKWGVQVEPSDIRGGDVLVESRGRSPGQTGGHVGFATGQVRFGAQGQMQAQMLSGNAGAGGAVTKAWKNLSELVVRRASEGTSLTADQLKRDKADKGDTRIKKESKDLDEWLAKSQQALALKQKENLIDKDITATADEKTAAKEREKLIQEGLLAVQEQYGTVSEANRAKVIAMADAMSKAGLASDQLKTQQKALKDQQEETTKSSAALAEQYTQIAKTAFSGFVNDLRNGVEAGEAFNNMLNRVIDGLVNMAIEALFSKDALGGLFSAGGAAGGGGGLGGFLGKIFGFGMHEGGTVGREATFMRGVPRTAFVGAKRYQRGGVAGFAPGEVPIIAHKGEVILPKGAQKSAAAGTNNTTTNNVAIRVDSNGNAVVTKDQGVGLGKRLNMVVQEEIARQQRAGGLLAGTGPGAR